MDDTVNSGEPSFGSSFVQPQFASRRAMREAHGTRHPVHPAGRPDGVRRTRPASSPSVKKDTLDPRSMNAGREVPTAEPATRRLRRAEIAAIHATAPKAPRKNPIAVFSSMLLVGAMFAVAGLPAFASTATIDPMTLKTDAAAQSITVGANVVAADTLRDGYRATSPQQLAEMTLDSTRAQNLTEYIASDAQERGDDYPWAYELSADQGGGLSPLNYYYRECVDFVAWRLNRDAGSYEAPYKFVWSTLTPTGGNASQWKYAWEQHGWEVSNTPITGSVAWWGSNHVAYVKDVLDNGDVLVEEYNYVRGLYGQRTIPASSVDAFLYPPT